MTGDVIVTPGSTFTVEPGVELLIAPGATLRVLGTLVMEGNPGGWINVTSTVASPTTRAHHWGSIFYASAQGTVFSPNSTTTRVAGSVIAYTRLEYGGGLVTTETPVVKSLATDLLLDHVVINRPRYRSLDLEAASPDGIVLLDVSALDDYYDWNTVGYNPQSGLVKLSSLGGFVERLTMRSTSATSSYFEGLSLSQGGSWTLLSLDMTNVGYYAVYTDNVAATSGSLLIEDAHISGFSNRGLSIGRWASITVRGGLIRNSGGTGVRVFSSSSGINQVLVDGVTTDNVRSGVYIAARYSASSAIVRSCVFRNYAGSGGSAVSSSTSSGYPALSWEVVNNTVSSMSISTSTMFGVYPSRDLQFRDNTITGSFYGFGTRIGVSSCLSGVVNVTDNVYQGNNGAYYGAVDFYQTSWPTGGCPSWTVERNVFDNSHPQEVRAPERAYSGLATADLSANLWGAGAFGSDIFARVQDLLDDSDLALALVSTVYESANFTSLVPLSGTGVVPNSEDLGGVLSSGTVYINNTDVAMTSSVLVLPGAHLVIGPNVTASIAPGIRFLVYGDLSLAGTAEGPVIMDKSDTLYDWGGFELYEVADPEPYMPVFDQDYNYVSGPRFSHVHLSHCGNQGSTTLNNCFNFRRPVPYMTHISVSEPTRSIFQQFVNFANSTTVYDHITLNDLYYNGWILGSYSSGLPGVTTVIRHVDVEFTQSTFYYLVGQDGPDVFNEPWVPSSLVLQNFTVAGGARNLQLERPAGLPPDGRPDVD